MKYSKFLYLILFIIFVSSLIGCAPKVIHRWNDKVTVGEFSVLGVKEVLAGDRVRLANDKIVQYIGIKSPNPGEPFYEEACEANRFLLRHGRIVLQFQEPLLNNRGHYLAYAFIPVQGELCFVNCELLQFGYAQVDLSSGETRYKREFHEAEQHAKTNKLGMWKY